MVLVPLFLQDYNGGALFFHSTSSVLLDSCSFVRSTAMVSIHAHSHTTYKNWDKKHFDAHGGTLYFDAMTSVSLLGCLFSHSTSAQV